MDLPSFPIHLTKKDARFPDEYPSTVTITSGLSIKIRFELADDENAIEYVAPDYGITEDNPSSITGKPKPDKHGYILQKDAAAYILGLFGIKGVRVICEEMPPMALAGGMESSSVFNLALTLAASILSGAELTSADILNLTVRNENDAFGQIAGGQGPISCMTGGVWCNRWLSGVKNKESKLVNPYSAFSTPLLTDEESLKVLENHVLLVQPGKRYKNGKPEKSRTANLVNIMWTDLLVYGDLIGFPLHEEKLGVTARYIEALEKGDFKAAAEASIRYVEIRDLVCKRWLQLAIDAHNKVKELPEYAYEYEKKVFDEDSPEYKNYELIREMYKNMGDNLKKVSFYTLDPIGRLVKDGIEKGIAFMPVGAGGPGANVFAMSAKETDHIREFLKTRQIYELTENVARNIIRGSTWQELKGYMPLEIGREPLKFIGFEKLELELPEPPQKVIYNEKDGTFIPVIPDDLIILDDLNNEVRKGI